MQFSLNIINVVRESPWKVLKFDFYIWTRTLLLLLHRESKKGATLP